MRTTGPQWISLTGMPISQAGAMFVSCASFATCAAALHHSMVEVQCPVGSLALPARVACLEQAVACSRACMHESRHSMYDGLLHPLSVQQCGAICVCHRVTLFFWKMWHTGTQVLHSWLAAAHVMIALGHTMYTCVGFPPTPGIHDVPGSTLCHWPQCSRTWTA